MRSVRTAARMVAGLPGAVGGLVWATAGVVTALTSGTDRRVRAWSPTSRTPRMVAVESIRSPVNVNVVVINDVSTAPGAVPCAESPTDSAPAPTPAATNDDARTPEDRRRYDEDGRSVGGHHIWRPVDQRRAVLRDINYLRIRWLDDNRRRSVLNDRDLRRRF